MKQRKHFLKKSYLNRKTIEEKNTNIIIFEIIIETYINTSKTRDNKDEIEPNKGIYI